MGEVWEAEDTALGRSVAIKVPRDGGPTRDAERWLVAEAHTVARLHHSNIVALLDQTMLRAKPGSSDDSVPALVFEYVAGEPLLSWTDRPRPWPWVRRVAEQALSALAYAHGRGVIHRDIKPSNFLLSGKPTDPQVSLLDFGIAAWDLRPQSFGELMPPPMDSGLLPATRLYMAPEQAQGIRGDVGPWTDLYSLGVVLLELLCGSMPFPGEDDEASWKFRLNNRFAPPVHAMAGLGAPLRRFLLRLLAPDSSQRYGWADDARRGLPLLRVEDLTTGPLEVSAEATDVMLESIRRPEDRETDADVEIDLEFSTDRILEPQQGLALSDSAPQEVHLPPSWAVDRPDPTGWDRGNSVTSEELQAPVPAVSYSLLSMRDAPLRGRTEEWSAAWNHLRSGAVADRPVFLLVEGPQGRGKTRFARELAAVAEEVGVARAYHVRFRADGSGAGALRRLISRVLRVTSLPESEREGRVRLVLAEAGYPADADLVPRVIGLLSPDRQTSRPDHEDSATAVELFRALSRRRQLLLWLEDIDRCRDRALTTWLSQLFDAEGELPVAVIATGRDDLLDDANAEDPDWVMLRARPETLSIKLDPLSEQTIADVLAFTAGTAVSLGEEIARWSRGDPRAARQIARHLHDTERLKWTPKGYELKGDTPSTAGVLQLDSILRSRAADAVRDSPDPEAMQGVLDLLSLVEERSRSEDLVATAYQLDLDERRVDAALGCLVVGALVDMRDEGPRLVHLALARSLASAMNIRRKVELRQAWASVLEGGGAGPGRAERLLEAAQHRAKSGQAREAAQDERRAAHLLRGRWESGAALRAAKRAMHRVENEAGLLRPEQEADLATLVAVLEHESREPQGTASELAGALDMLHPLWVGLEPSLDGSRAALLHAEALRDAGRPADALDALERGLEIARTVSSASWECRSLTQLSGMLRARGDLARAEQLSQEALSLAQSLGDDALLLDVLRVRIVFAIGRMERDRARMELEKYRRLLRARATWQDLQQLWLFRGDIEVLENSIERAHRAYDNALVLGRTRGLANTRVLLRQVLLRLEQGDIDGAGTALHEVDAVGQGSGGRHEDRAFRAVMAAELAIRSAELTRAASAIQDAEILQRQSPIADRRLAASLERSSQVCSHEALRARIAPLLSDMRDRLSGMGRTRRGSSPVGP